MITVKVISTSQKKNLLRFLVAFIVSILNLGYIQSSKIEKFIFFEKNNLNSVSKLDLRLYIVYCWTFGLTYSIDIVSKYS